MEKGNSISSKRLDDEVEESAATILGTNNGQVNGSSIVKEPVASYRSIPDDDSKWQERRNQSSEKLNDLNKLSSHNMGKLNDEVASVDDDGANEKMLLEENTGNIVTAKELASPTEVKFVTENGDAKIDIETVKKSLSGMGKEELMKYANDPFWIRLRWFLFIGFWVLWIGMLAGAIAIIVMAPKCAAPEPKKWWESSPIVQLEPEDLEGRDANSIGDLLDAMKSQHIDVISLSNFIGVDGHTKDFRNVEPSVASIETLNEIIKAAKARDQRVILEIDPNHSSLDHSWFESSVKREEPYTDYYVWADSKVTGSAANGKPPNNWLSVNGGSAWEWNKDRGQYYLHQFNKTQPDLNFNNPAVVAEFGEILNHWIGLGITGFRLGNTRYLIEDPKLADELHGTSAASPEEYEYLNHVRTVDRSENGEILRQWRNIVANKTNNDGHFALRDNIAADTLAVYNQNRTLIDAPQSSMFFETATGDITAETLNKSISLSIATSGGWPAWDVNGNAAKLRSRMPDDVAESLILMTLLLPGVPIFKLNDTLSSKEAFATIAKARNIPTALYGSTETAILNGTVFVYTRLKSGNPGYLVAYQSSDEPANVDFSVLKSVSSEVNVVARSSNYARNNPSASKETKLPSNNVPMPPKSTLVVTFVPKD